MKPALAELGALFMAGLPGLDLDDSSRQLIHEYGVNHFILFKPKDIVSGDFYWLNIVDEKLIIAVADCTGHGVPGAFMSMLGIAFLNDIINKTYITEPHKVLGMLREEVISTSRKPYT